MIVTGYASLFNVRDNGSDVVKKGAFQNTIRKRKPKAVKFLWAHNQHEPIGVLNRLYEDDRGLKYEAEIDERMRYGPTAIAAVERGIADVSIGYKAIDPRFVKDTRELYEVDLREVSLVMIAMLDGTSAFAPSVTKVTVAEKANGEVFEVLGVMNIALATAAAQLALAAHTAR